MDANTLWMKTFGHVPGALWPLLLLGLLVGLVRWFAPSIKGWLGEQAVRRRLDRDLPAGWRVLHDVTLEPAPGDTTQIDHIAIGPGGITVIETKCFKGWIFGDARAAQWTQVIYRHRTRFQNPFRQNWRHVQVLAALLELPPAQLQNAVVLLGARWKGDTCPDGLYFRASDLVRAIRARPAGMLAPAEVQRLAARIESLRLAPGHASRRRHVANLRRRHRS